MKDKKERIKLLVEVEIQYDSPEARRFAISQAKENVMAVSNGWVCSPKKVKLFRA